jgi:hypothetical protein
MAITHRRYLLILSVLFLVLWTALAIKPVYRDDWMVENILVVVSVVLFSAGIWARRTSAPRETYGTPIKIWRWRAWEPCSP